MDNLSARDVWLKVLNSKIHLLTAVFANSASIAFSLFGSALGSSDASLQSSGRLSSTRSM